MGQNDDPTGLIYSEKLTSIGTSLFFAFLSFLFFLLFAWLYSIVGWRFFTGLCLGLGIFFFLYVINYRDLIIRITDEKLILRFGIVPWKSELKNIMAAEIDDSPAIIRYGGAGVHFAFVGAKYRAYFNFLEYPRVAVHYKEKQGLVRSLVFSTKFPDEIIRILETRMIDL